MLLDYFKKCALMPLTGVMVNAGTTPTDRSFGVYSNRLD